MAEREIERDRRRRAELVAERDAIELERDDLGRRVASPRWLELDRELVAIARRALVAVVGDIVAASERVAAGDIDRREVAIELGRDPATVALARLVVAESERSI
jgi:hypothetical protein